MKLNDAFSGCSSTNCRGTFVPYAGNASCWPDFQKCGKELRGIENSVKELRGIENSGNTCAIIPIISLLMCRLSKFCASSTTALPSSYGFMVTANKCIHHWEWYFVSSFQLSRT